MGARDHYRETTLSLPGSCSGPCDWKGSEAEYKKHKDKGCPGGWTEPSLEDYFGKSKTIRGFKDTFSEDFKNKNPGLFYQNARKKALEKAWRSHYGCSPCRKA